jgi:hypothetical protein
MNGMMLPALSEWDGFYVIVGSAAGALIGLQFVVMTLIADRPEGHPPDAAAGAAFGSPTIVHFAATLVLAAILHAPWPKIATAATAWGLLGICGVAYSILVVRRMWRQTAYQPVFEDWLFHALLPIVAYSTLAVSAFTNEAHARDALFAVGGAGLLLLLIGIHNSWDAVTHHVLTRNTEERQTKARGN